MYRIQYYDKNGNYREIHGFKTPKEAENYVKNIQIRILVSIH